MQQPPARPAVQLAAQLPAMHAAYLTSTTPHYCTTSTHVSATTKRRREKNGVFRPVEPGSDSKQKKWRSYSQLSFWVPPQGTSREKGLAIAPGRQCAITGRRSARPACPSSRLRVSEIVALVVEIRAEEARKYNAATKEAPVEAE